MDLAGSLAANEGRFEIRHHVIMIGIEGFVLLHFETFVNAE